MLIQLMKDITQGSEMGKAMAFYTLDALVAMDADQAVLTQLQTRGLLQGCLQDISTNSYQVRPIYYQQFSEECLLGFLSAYLEKNFLHFEGCSASLASICAPPLYTRG